jgi:hypothetical protein
MMAADQTGNDPHTDHSIMPEQPPIQRLELTLSLSPTMAQRLMKAAESQKRTASDVAMLLLDKYLPPLDSGGKKTVIPYV